MEKKYNNVPDKIIKFGEQIMAVAKEYDYDCVHTNDIFRYHLIVMEKTGFAADTGLGLIFILGSQKKHLWCIRYLKSYKDNGLSEVYFNEKDFDYEKEVQKWTKYIRKYSQKIKKKSIFERTEKLQEDFE